MGCDIHTYVERQSADGFLGPQFFADLAVLRDAETHGPTRVVFWFDN